MENKTISPGNETISSGLNNTKRVLATLFLIVLVDLIGIGIAVPVLAVLFLDTTGGVLPVGTPLPFREIMLGLLIASYGKSKAEQYEEAVGEAENLENERYGSALNSNNELLSNYTSYWIHCGMRLMQATDMLYDNKIHQLEQKIDRDKHAADWVENIGDSRNANAIAKIKDRAQADINKCQSEIDALQSERDAYDKAIWESVNAKIDAVQKVVDDQNENLKDNKE